MFDEPLAFATDVFAQEQDDFLNLFREMPDGLEPLGLDATDEGDALGVLKKWKPS